MKKFAAISILCLCFEATAQFEVVPTGTTSPIENLVMHDDTLIISGKFNYFAKSFDFGETVAPLVVPGLPGYANFDFQVVQDKYYVLSVEGAPYEHNYVLKSDDNGFSWNTQYDTSGLFFTLTMLDTTYGVMGGTAGAFAMTQGNDNFWLLDTLFSAILASEAYGDSTMIMMANLSFCYVTNDRGNIWNWISGPSEQHEEIQFLDEDTVYAIAHQGTLGPNSFFYYSNNGGYSWSTVSIGYNSSTLSFDYYSKVFDLYFDSPQHGYILGYNYDLDEAMILETNDFGINWTMNPIGIEEELYTFLNVNDSLAFLGGENGLVLKWDKKTATCDVELSSTAASCPTCCDACISFDITSACPPYTLSWSPSDPNPCAACPFTTYVLTVWDDCGCSVTDSITVDTIPVGGGAIIQEHSDLFFDIIPNPANSHFILRVSDSQLISSDIVILSADGKEIYREPFGNQLSKEVDISGFQDGTYLIVLEGEKRVLVRRLVIGK